jgi:hypothetical protein
MFLLFLHGKTMLNLLEVVYQMNCEIMICL